MAPQPPSRARATSERFSNIYLGISSLVLVALIIIVVILVFRVGALATTDDNNSVAACQQQNINLVTDQRIFQEILALPAIASPQFITAANAAAQRVAVARIETDISTAYAQRNCVALFSTK
jgi:hypothetical protein